MSTNDDQLDMDSIRARLSTSHGKEYWRSLEELAETPEFEELLHREFPRQASEWNDPAGRRKFLQLMGASLALAGLTACTRQPPENIAPYIRQPEEIVPGNPLFYATAMTLGGAASGLLAESHEGRPTKIEGNPEHPASLGATDLFAQASVLGLYDPDRSQTLTYLGDTRPYAAFLGQIRSVVLAQQAIQGAGLRILTETVNSPALADQLRQFLADFPSAKWHEYEPANRDSVRAGARLAFGEPVNTIYHFDRADVIFAIDSDFLSSGPGHLRYVRDFSAKRRLAEGKSDMSRLYEIESTLSLTGAKADHRLPLRPSEIEPFARAVAAKLGVQTGASSYTAHTDWIDTLAGDLRQHSGKSIVIPGDYQSPFVHALSAAMNQALGNVGNTVTYTDPIEANPADQTSSLSELLQDIDANKVDALVILGGNPVYSAPADLNFKERFQKVGLRIHLSLYNDETSELCQWHIPETHYLESWSDARAYDGTASIVQPLIAPLYRGKSAHEVLAAFSSQPERTSYDIVRGYWQTRMGAGEQGSRGAGEQGSR
ncbi:MAG: TAT-variant-translocated molybdopterin oxidoreductase, partial [Blastocatellia bacterium]|nr:TAT-variant-translocated molybdopterin oxidoreductase [Blastocatellia bacterium]